MLDSLHIKNFRCFEDLTIPSLGRVNLIVGKNNSGKSTLLEAINLYANVGHDDVVNEILEKRGDLYLASNKHYNFARPSIFHQDTIPDSFENRLEIGNTTASNCVQILPSTAANNIKEKFNTFNNTSFAIATKSNTSLIITNLRNKKIISTNEKDPISSSPTDLASENTLASIWDNIFLNMDDSILKSALQTIDKNITNIAFIPKGDSINGRIAVVKKQGMSKAIPIKGMGDGVARLLQIFLYALQAKGGFLLIDEFENGLHYSIQEEVWEKLFKLAKDIDIQVFATTHSQDTLKAFAKVALNSPEEGRIIYLGRHTRKQDPDNGKISALVYDENDIEMILQTGMEVR